MDKLQPIIDSAQTFFRSRTNLILVAVIALLVIGGIFVLTKILHQKPPQLPIEEVDLPFDPNGPYAILMPRRDGNALNLTINRVSSYESISYELAYQSTISQVEHTDAEEGSGKIDRGVQGSINTHERKSEYSQEILFGTCSQGFTEGGAHCVFDEDVENGTLTLKIQLPYKKGDKTTKVYRMITTWHLQKPDVALGSLNSADSHFIYKTDASQEDLSTTGFSIINDLTAIPKLPEGKAVFGKVYALNIPKARSIPKGQLTIETIDNPASDAKIAYYAENQNAWKILDTSIDATKLSSEGPGAGIYAILVNSN